jgi:predicted MFS family arabinose efflux permease
MAFVGDVTPYDQRQTVLARYLSGQILGQLFGQAAGGILGDLFGWRNVFFLLAGLFTIATIALIIELITNPVTRAPRPAHETSRGFVADYSAVLKNRWARIVIISVAIEGACAWGAYAYVGADLHMRYGLSFTWVGAFVAAFAVGGLIYALSVKILVNRLGQRGLAVTGGIMLGVAYLVLAAAPAWWIVPAVTVSIGLGFYMLHNTLQTNATQMTPEARGTAVAIFSSALYLGQTVGVAIAAVIIDRFSAAPLFLAVAIALPALAFWFAHELRRHGTGA